MWNHAWIQSKFLVDDKMGHKTAHNQYTTQCFQCMLRKREKKKNKIYMYRKQVSNEMKERINSINFFGILCMYALSCSFGRHSHKWKNDITCTLQIEFEMNEEKNPSAIVHRSSTDRKKKDIHCSLLGFEINIQYIFSVYVLNCKACSSKEPRAPLEMIKLFRIVKCVEGAEYGYYNYYYCLECWREGGGEIPFQFEVADGWVGRCSVYTTEED